jgi:hypothetical protein
MGIIATTARKLHAEGNSIEKILDAVQAMEDGAKPAKKGREGSPRLELAQVLDEVHTTAVLEYRQRIGHPLTGYAAKLLAKELKKTMDPNATADLMIAKGWRSYFADWNDGNGARNNGGHARAGSRNEEQALAFDRAAEPYRR